MSPLIHVFFACEFFLVKVSRAGTYKKAQNVAGGEEELAVTTRGAINMNHSSGARLPVSQTYSMPLI
jgi:hypothetical protein